jgi:hypothetical protein
MELIARSLSSCRFVIGLSEFNISSLRNSRQRIISQGLIAKTEIRIRSDRPNALFDYLSGIKIADVEAPVPEYSDNRDKSVMINWMNTTESIPTRLRGSDEVPGKRGDIVDSFHLVPVFLRLAMERDSKWTESFAKLETQEGVNDHIIPVLMLVGNVLKGIEQSIVSLI